jgi:NADH-quinone oxidoreductase subunit H
MSHLTLLKIVGLPPDWPGGFWWHLVVLSLIIIGFLLTTVIIFIWYERRLLGRFQIRLGPNRAGPFGLLQPVADVLKVLTKEDIIPTKADKLVFWLAPVAAFAPVLLVLAVVPFHPGLALTNLDIGLVYILAISSISSIGIFMAGYAGHNKYGLVGAMRDVAQIVSYEIPLVLSLAGVALSAGALSVSGIVASQTVPFILLQPLGFLVFFLATLAEINRTPFDLVEADSELAAGYNIEYSGMKFAMLYLVEYSEAVVASVLITTFFLGGWQGPWLPPIVWLIIKMLAAFSFIIWVRATLPRVRIDQSLGFAWKFLLPLAVINLILTGVRIVLWPELTAWLVVPVSLVITFFLVLAWSRLFKPGRFATHA